MDNIPDNIDAECEYYEDEYENLMEVPSNGKKPMGDFEEENNQMRIKPEYMEDLSHFINFTPGDIIDARKHPLYEKPIGYRKEEESILEVLFRNDIRFESPKELDEILMRIRQNYKWEPGFNLQLGSKGRKIMLQLLRRAYRINKKNKTIFSDKNPPTTISNLPFFKLTMLWELSYDLGIFEYAVIIHQIFGTQRRKIGSKSEGWKSKKGGKGSRKRGRRGSRKYKNDDVTQEEETKINEGNQYSQNMELSNQEQKKKDKDLVTDLLNEEDFFSSMNQNYNSVRFRYSTIDQFYQSTLMESYPESQESYMTTDESEITNISEERENMYMNTRGSLKI